MDGAPGGARGSRQGATRLTVVLLALTTLVVNDGLIPARAGDGSGLGRSIAATRRSQSHAQRAMRRADRRISAMKRARAQHGQRARAAIRRLERVKERRGAVRRRARSAGGRLRLARRDLERQLAVRPHPLGMQPGSRPPAHRDVRVLATRVRLLERTARELERKTRQAQRAKGRRARPTARFRQRLHQKVRRRDAAEVALGAAIRRMADLSRARATRLTDVRPARSGFRKPARGRITQRFGCTASRRGRCRGFHDGVDIAAPPGTRVRASATGVVAYVGWNPWDHPRRAFMVIIGHRGGFETLYAHLKPIRRVRAGQLVRRGQTIGLMGSTGHSSGPHVHWELRRGSSIVDPLRFR